MTIAIQLKSRLQWLARQSETSDRWIGVCDSMNLAMEADSLDELHSVIAEAIHVLLIDLLEDDEFDAFLQERGWTATGIPRGPVNRDVEFDVPWELVAEGARDSQRRAC